MADTDELQTGNSTVKANTTTLIVAEPGRMRDGLRTLLGTMPGLAVIGEAGDSSQAQDMVTEFDPTLVLLDADLVHGSAWDFLRWISETHPYVRCLVLATSWQKLGIAKTNGAQGALLKGFGLVELLTAINTVCEQVVM